MLTLEQRMKAAEVAHSLNELEALPEVVTKTLQLLRDSRSNVQQVATVVSLDQGLTAMTLAMANSSFFGATRRFVSVGEAIVRLGYKNLQAILYAASASHTLSRPVTLYGLGRNDLWKHSIACALCCRLIAQHSGAWDPEEAYVAGLLHDIGIPALENHASNKSDLASLIQAGDYEPHTAERMVLGFDHAYLGSLICEKWQLAGNLVSAIADHHDPPVGEVGDRLPGIVHLADVISTTPEMGIWNSNISIRPREGVIDWLELQTGTIERLIPELLVGLQNSEDLILGAPIG
jgi:putative nucleotidyltransferase with HDIG domain